MEKKSPEATIPDPTEGFIGTYLMKVDPKNRLIVPPKIREALYTIYKEDRGEVIITISLDPAIMVFPKSGYNAFFQNLEEKSELNRDVRHLLKIFRGFIDKQKLDSQHRIRLSPSLCEQARIKREVYVIGLKTYFEIWDKEQWQQFLTANLQKRDDMADHVAKSIKDIL